MVSSVYAYLAEEEKIGGRHTSLICAGIQSTGYDRTPTRDLLHISSPSILGKRGTRDEGRDPDRLWRDTVIGGLIFQEGHGRQHHVIQSTDRAAGNRIPLCQHRTIIRLQRLD
jgi:hypothetical protein